MDIERMHSMIEKLSESALSEFEKGIECVDTCEMGAVIDMIKDLAEAEYYATLAKTMQESDTEDVMAMLDRYGDKRMTAEMYHNTESGYDRAKRFYTETKELHRSNTTQDKEAKMKGLEEYFREISNDITGLLADMTQEERTMLKSKLNALATKL